MGYAKRQEIIMRHEDDALNDYLDNQEELLRRCATDECPREATEEYGGKRYCTQCLDYMLEEE